MMATTVLDLSKPLINEPAQARTGVPTSSLGPLERFIGTWTNQNLPNQNDDGVRQGLIESVGNIFTCNETYSDMQSWVNGSLRSADRVLSKFNIQPLVDDSSNTDCTPKEGS
ncbi:MAG: hypothetical protein JKX81_19675 [Arenicella sp.]|nr:hypothetical protein [Arenicella sp.]